MSTVTPAFAHSMASAVGLKLMADGSVLSGDQVVHRLSQSLDGQLDANAYFDFIEWLRQRHPDRPTLVAACARAIEFDKLGVLGLALKTAPTLRASLQRLERYFRLLTDTAVYQLDESHDRAFFSLQQRTLGHPALTLRNECALAGVVHNAGLLVEGEARFDYATFRHDCVGNPGDYEAVFGMPVHFRAEKDGIAMATRTLDLPNRLGDRAVSDFMTGHLERELNQSDVATPLRVHLLRRISATLNTGAPSAAALARDLGMSERTLFRRLSDEGTTLREVMREAQIGLARELLHASNCSLTEVAFLAGFSDQSTFGRAFKRHEGQTPAQYRARRKLPLCADAETVLAGYAQTLAGPANTDLSTPV